MYFGSRVAPGLLDMSLIMKNFAILLHRFRQAAFRRYATPRRFD